MSIRFAVSSLNGFTISIECFTVPPMSVVSNKIWTNCFVPIIRFLVILFSRRVDVNHLDYSSRFSRQVPKQVMNSFDVPTLFVLLEFCSIVLISSIFRLHSYNYLSHFVCKKYYDIPENLPQSRFFLLLDYTITVNGNVYNVFEICGVML